MLVTLLLKYMKNLNNYARAAVIRMLLFIKDLFDTNILKNNEFVGAKASEEVVRRVSRVRDLGN